MRRALIAAVGMGTLLWAACSSDDTTGTPPVTNDAGGGDSASTTDSGSTDTGTPVTDSGTDAPSEAGGGLEPGPYRIVYSGTGGTGIDQRRPITLTSTSGQLDSWTFGTDPALVRGTAKTGELHADSSSLLGRWNDGTVNGFPAGAKTYTDKEGFHYALVPDSATAPTTGTIAYTFAKATSATIDDGSLAVGTVTGKLGIAFSASGKKAGFELTIDMPGDAQYTATTTGGSADPTQSTELTGNTSFPLVGGEMPVTSTGAGCQGASPCKVSMRMFVGGGTNGAARAVLAFVVSSGTTAKTVRGTMVFKAP